MRTSVVVLLFLSGVYTPYANAPGRPASLGALVLQTANANTDKAPTVEQRTSDLKELEESGRLALNSGQTLEAARILNRVGRLYLLLNKPQDALANHLQALELLRQSPDPQVEIDGLNGSAAAYVRLEQQQPLAQAALDKSLALSKQIRYTVGEAETLLTLSDLQSHVNQTTALLTAQSALTLLRTLNDRAGSARAYIQIGRCYFAQNTLTSAGENFVKALELSRIVKDVTQQAEALIMLGFIEFRKGEWQGSIDYYTQAYGLIDETEEPARMGQIASGVGAAFLENGLPDQGLVQYQRALEYYRRAKEPVAESYAMLGIARSYYLQGDLTQASSYIHQSLEPVAKDSLSAGLPLEIFGKGSYRSW